jgi:peptidoglycan/LPS O-acetylase OafA/YrhL
MYRSKAFYRADVDGLRAISILAVVGFHAFPSLVPGGFVGVDVFFVISGYLISIIIFTDLASGTFSFTDFYSRRAKRILPALLLVLVAVWIVGWRTLLPSDFERLGRDIAAGASYLSNIFFWNDSGYFDKLSDQKPLLHLWSLGVEEQFYVLFPAVIFLAWKNRLNLLLIVVAIGILSFASNVAVVFSHPSDAFYLPHTRFWELMIGSGLAYAQLFLKTPSRLTGITVRNSYAVLGSLLLLGAMLALPDSHFPGWWALIPTAGAAFLVFSGHDAWLNRTILSSRPLVFVGLISYPLYLWHWPILSFARLAIPHSSNDLVRIGLIAAAFFLAWLTYEFVEKPVRFDQLRVPPAALAVSLAGLAMLVVTPLGLSTLVAKGLPTRFPPALRWTQQNDSQTFAAYRQGTCLLPLGAGHFFPDDCVDKEDLDEPLIFLWGDSHAGHLYPGLQHQRRHFRFRLAQFTTPGCPPLLHAEFRYAPRCKERNDDVFNRIAALKPEWVILSAWWASASHEDLLALNDTFAALKSVEVPHVLVVGHVPSWRNGLRLCLQQYYVEHAVVPERMKTGLVLNPQLDGELGEQSRLAGAIYVSPIEAMCNGEGCVTRVGDDATDIVAWDGSHLTVAGSIYLVDRFPSALFGQSKTIRPSSSGGFSPEYGRLDD